MHVIGVSSQADTSSAGMRGNEDVLAKVRETMIIFAAFYRCRVSSV